MAVEEEGQRTGVRANGLREHERQRRRNPGSRQSMRAQPERSGYTRPLRGRNTRWESG